MDKDDKILEGVTELKVEVARHTERLDNYNSLLAEHIKGVKHLDARLRPIEDHVKFLRSLSHLTVKVVGVVAGLAAVGKLVLELLK